MHNTRPHSSVNPKEIITRNAIARNIVTGFSAQLPALAEYWDYLATALADTPIVTAELSATRLDRANLLAAMRATLTAHADGEADPLSYIRDELDARQKPSQSVGGAS
jgi:hypothetical protein